jgi:hypothetical protein
MHTPHPYSFCLLQYHHSVALGEVLNAGLLVYLHEERTLHFLYPDRLLRLRLAYPQLAEKTLRQYCKHFEKRADELNAQREIFTEYALESGGLPRLIEAELLPPDASALRFGSLRRGIYYTDAQSALANLYNQFFYLFDDAPNRERVDDRKVLTRYKLLLRELGLLQPAEGRPALIQYKYKAKLAPDAEYTFDVAWRDTNTLHLVEPASFDYKERIDILNRTDTLYGRFTKPSAVAFADTHHCTFDLLLAPPRVPELFRSYDNAIKLLDEVSHLKLVTPDELSRYSQQTIEALF